MIRSTEEYISVFDVCLEEEEKERRFEKVRESIGEEKERTRMMMILHAGGDFAHIVKLMCEI